MVISLDELKNSDNLKDGMPSNVLSRHYMTWPQKFARFEPATLKYKRLKNWELNSLNLRMTDQNDNIMTECPEIMIDLHIRD